MGINPALENALRPFNDLVRPLPRTRTYWNDTPAAAPATTTDAESTDGVLTWSARADVQVQTLPGMNVRMKEDTRDTDLNELTREVDVKRITNPEDAGQYVDVEVVRTLTLTNKAKQKRIFTLNNEDDA